MKKQYIKPQTEIVACNLMPILTSASVSVGNKYSPGDTVLSRRGGSWDEEEEDY